MTISQAREQGERLSGRRLDDQSFEAVLDYTTRKSRMTGHTDDYIPLLLVDEINNYVYRERMKEKRRIMAATPKEEKACAPFACTLHACVDALMRKYPFMERAAVAETISRLAADMSISMEAMYAKIVSMT